MKNKKHNKLHKYNRTLCSVALSSALAVVAVGSALPMVAQATDSTDMTRTTGRTLYVGDNETVNGLRFRDLRTALAQAQAGDTVLLTSNIVYQEQNTEGLQINKDVTIDGQNSYTLTVRASTGKGIDMHADLTLKDMTLNIVAENNSAVINVGGNSLTIDNVSTKLSKEQPNERPTIIGGKSDKPDAHTRITVIGTNTETRFRDIYAGDDKADSQNSVTIDIQNVYTRVDNGIKLGGKDGHSTTGKVTVETKSQNITVMDGTGSSDNHVTFTDTNISSPIRIPGVKKLTAQGNNTGLIVQGSTNGPSKIDELEVKDNAEVILGDSSIDDDQSITIGTLTADPTSTVLLQKDAKLTLDKTEGKFTIKIKDFNKYKDGDKTFITVNESADGLTVKPEADDPSVTFEKEGNSFKPKSDVTTDEENGVSEGSSDEHSSENGHSSSVTPPPPPAPPAPPAKPETVPNAPATPPEEPPAPPASQPQNPPSPAQPEGSGSQDSNTNKEEGSETTHDGNETHAPGSQGENGGSGDDKQGENSGTTDTSSGDTASGSNGPDTSNTGSGAGSADTGVGSVGTDGTASGNATGGPNGSDTGATESTNGSDATDTSSGGVQNGSNQDTPAADAPDADNQADEPAAEPKDEVTDNSEGKPAEPKKENEPAPESDKEGANKEEANNDSSSSTEGSSSQPADLPKPAEKSIKDRIMDTLKGLFTENNLDEKQQQSAVEKTAESLNDLAATYTDYDFSFSLDAARVAENRLNDLAALNGLESAANDNYAFLAQSAKALKNHNSVWVSSSLAEQRGDGDSKRRLSTINLGYDRQFDNLILGGFVSYLRQKGERGELSSKLHGYSLSLYGKYSQNAHEVVALLNVGRTKADLQRNISALSVSNNAETKGKFVGVRAEYGYRMVFEQHGLQVKPIVALNYNLGRQAAFTESGTMPVHVGKIKAQRLALEAGVELKKYFENAYVYLKPTVQTDLMARSNDVDVRFVDTPNSIPFKSTAKKKTYFALSLGTQVQLRKDLLLDLNANSRIGNHERDIQGSVKLSYKF